MLTINVALEEKDYLFFNNYLELGSPGKRKKDNRLFLKKITFYIGAAVFFMCINLKMDYYNSNIFSAMILTAVFIMVVGRFSRPIGIVKMVKSVYALPENEYIFENKEYTFNESGIAITGKSFSTKANWNFIIKKIETEEYILLYVAAKQAYIIPKRFFNNPQTGLLDKLFAEHLNLQADAGHIITE